MKLVMFGIDSQKNLIIQFPVFAQPYMQTELTLYQIETVPVPILDASNKIQSYTQLKIEKPYIALNDLLDRNILCNCDIEAENNFLLELLAVCGEHDKPDLEMYLTVNLAFVDYLEELNESIKTPINRNWTSFKQPLPVSLESFQLNSKLLHAPVMLRDFIDQYQENRITAVKHPTSKFRPFMNSFLIDMLVFIVAILTVFIIFVIIYIITGQSKLKALVATMALQRVRAVDALNINRQSQNCNSELLKILMILNIVIVVSLLL